MSDRGVAVGFGVAILVFIALLVLALRPSLVLGVDGEALGNSVNEGGVLGGPTDSCRKLDESWECTVYGVDGSNSGRYEVTVDAWGCWEARPLKRPSAPSAFDGCITLLNH